MCLIIHKPTAGTIIPDHILDNAENINPDGFGIVYTDTNQCVRTMDYNHARELILDERPFVAHYRYATRGSINKATCHPYHVQDLVRLFSNGTVADLGDKTTCDTAVVAQTLKQLPPQYWDALLQMTETRFAITHPDGSVSRHGTWHEKDGIFYSKNNCFHVQRSTIGYHYGTCAATYRSRKDTTSRWDNWDDWEDYKYNDIEEPAAAATPLPSSTMSDIGWPTYDWEGIDLVAVYGTLKAGHSNHDVLGESSYIGAGKTVNKHAMQARGIPYVYEHDHRDQIEVEVYEAAQQHVKTALDNLESHPTFYERKLIDIELYDGSVKTCWLYFAQTSPMPNVEYIRSY